MIPEDRPFPFGNFYMVPRALGEFDGVVGSQFSCFPSNKISLLGILRHNPIVCTPSVTQLVLYHCPSLTFCWAFAPLQHVENGTSCHNCIPFSIIFTLARESALSSPGALTSAAWSFQRFLHVGLCFYVGCWRRRVSFSSLSPVFVPRCRIMGETTWFFFGTLSVVLPLYVLPL